jgi:hypothetical protein
MPNMFLTGYKFLCNRHVTKAVHGYFNPLIINQFLCNAYVQKVDFES